MEGSPPRTGGHGGGVRAAHRISSGAGWGSSRNSGLTLSRRRMPELDAERRYERRGVRVADPKACPVRRGAQGRDQSRGSARCLAPLAHLSGRSGPAWSRPRALARPTTATVATDASAWSRERFLREQRMLGDRARLRRQQGQVSRRAHHDGARRRRQGVTVISRRGCCCRPFSQRRARPARRRGRHPSGGHRARAEHRQLSSSSQSASPGGQSGAGRQWDGQRPRCLRRAPGRAHALARARGGPQRRRPARGDRGDRRRTAAAAGVQVVAGDTQVVERGFADKMYVCTTGLGVLDRRAELGPPRSRPAIASSSPGESPSTASQSCSRAKSSPLDAEIQL